MTIADQADATEPPVGAGITPIYVNQFQVWAYANGTVRIILGDVIDTEHPNFTSAFVLTASDAKELAAILIKTIDDALVRKKNG